MWSWYLEEIFHPGRQPLFLALVAFVVTFLTTRAITRLIRSGRGPFRNVESGGVHVHHVIPGLICVLIGGLLALGASPHGPLRDIAGLLFGAGAALVLDEFAMILHLDDVYWESEGKLSADVVMLAAVVGLMALMVAAPNRRAADEVTGFWWTVASIFSFIAIWLLPMAITILKGKLWTAAVAVFMIPFAWVGAIRVGKPHSPWAHMRYKHRPVRMAKACKRAERSARRWAPVRAFWQQRVFGMPPDPPAADAAGTDHRNPVPTAGPSAENPPKGTSAD